MRSFVFGAGLYFFVRLRFRQGAVAPSSSARAAGLWGRVAPIPKASASFVKSPSKVDGKLVGAICAHFTRLGKGFSPFWLANPCLHPGSLAINQSRAAQYWYSKNLPPEADHDAVPTPPGISASMASPGAGNGCARQGGAAGGAARSQPDTRGGGGACRRVGDGWRPA